MVGSNDVDEHGHKLEQNGIPLIDERVECMLASSPASIKCSTSAYTTLSDGFNRVPSTESKQDLYHDIPGALPCWAHVCAETVRKKVKLRRCHAFAKRSDGFEGKFIRRNW